MNIKFFLLLSVFLIGCMGIFGSTWADIPTDAQEIIQSRSIGVQSPQQTGDPIEFTQNIGFKVLGFAKLIISGLALIYMVLIGAYMVVFSENEDRIKSQKKQITYTLVGFLFLNIPGILIQLFTGGDKSGNTIATDPTGGWGSIFGGFFWDDTITSAFIGNMIGFFQVFIFGIAITMFTWGLFRLIISGGDEEILKKAKNRILYGTLGLIFMGFVRLWGAIIATTDFAQNTGGFQTLTRRIFELGLYFAGPIAIFFLMLGGYYYITSGGDEEKTKKGKAIITNTFIATLILLAAYSFLADLITFTA